MFDKNNCELQAGDYIRLGWNFFDLDYVSSEVCKVYKKDNKLSIKYQDDDEKNLFISLDGYNSSQIKRISLGQFIIWKLFGRLIDYFIKQIRLIDLRWSCYKNPFQKIQ